MTDGPMTLSTGAKLNLACRKSYVWIPWLVSVLAFVGMVIGGVGAFLNILMIFGLFMGTGALAFQMLLREDALTGEFLVALQQKEEASPSEYGDLTKQLQSLGPIPGIESGLVNGERQLALLSEKMKLIKEFLTQKLRTGELTYERYLSAATRTQKSMVDQLNQGIMIAKTIGMIQATGTSSGSAAVNAAVEDRQDKRQEQVEKFNQIIASNEQALTKLAELAIAISSIGTKEPSEEMEQLLGDLQDLTERAKLFN